MRLWGQMALVRVRSRKVLAGHPAYKVTGGEVIFQGRICWKWNRKNEPRLVFLAFQYPVGNSGVKFGFLACGYNSRRKQHGLEGN